MEKMSEGQNPSLLSLRDVNISFGSIQALKSVDFDVAHGEVHCLAGENGCGKSTLIKVISGVYKPDIGARIHYNGKDYPNMSPSLAQAGGVRVIWQDLALFPEMTVAENISFQMLVGRFKRVDFAKIRQQARDMLHKLGISLDLDKKLKHFTIAQRQMVAIARALIGNPKIVFMDEPTASLTQVETDALLNIVRNLSQAGIAVVFVSHRLAEVLEISQRITVLRDGRLVGIYPTTGMTQSRLGELMTGKTFERKQRAQTQTLPQQPVLEQFPKSVTRFSEENCGKIQELEYSAERSETKTVLEVKNLSRTGEFEDISLTVRQGEILGIVGLLGAGRSELALTLFGMNKAHSGSIELEGRKVHFSSNRQAIQAGIGYLSEDRLNLGLVQAQPIDDNLVISSLKKILRFGFLSKSKKHTLVSHWVEELGIKTGSYGNAVSTLSGGNQQRIAIARWLAIQPKLLILDAPTVGVDVGARSAIFDIVSKLAKNGLAIILISDEVGEVYYNSDRILHMAHGRIIGEYSPEKSTLKAVEEAVYA